VLIGLAAGSSELGRRGGGSEPRNGEDVTLGWLRGQVCGAGGKQGRDEDGVQGGQRASLWRGAVAASCLAWGVDTRHDKVIMKKEGRNRLFLS
jgi:hypothetical protein